MKNEIPERITYAQKKLIGLISQRKLRSWCQDNGLSHTAVYRYALGKVSLVFRLAASMSHLIPPVEFLYYTDEPIPYEPKVAPKWNPESTSVFIQRHRNDYHDIAKRYGIPDVFAYKIFVQQSAMPTISFIRACCMDTDPIEFFVEAEASTYIPERGDIVSSESSLLFIVSKKEFCEKKKLAVCCPVISSCEDGIELKKTKAKGFVNTNEIVCIKLQERSSPLLVVESTDAETLKKVLLSVRKIFE